MRVIRKSSLSALRGKKIAVVGYGSQGRAQALNLRDSGLRPTIGLHSKSRSRAIARRDGMVVRTPAVTANEADIIFLLAPDHLHGEIFKNELKGNLHSGQLLVFAHASSIHFGLVRPPAGLDVVLLAPLGPGKRLRELRGRRDGLACFIAIDQDYSGKAREIVLALARAIGCIPAGAIETTFAEEAVGDLFGEQAVLCGGLSALLQAGVETLVRHGAKPENAYLECVYQLDLIVDLIKTEGLRGMFEQISATAAYGAKVAGPMIVSAQVRKAMDRIHRNVRSGEFMRRWLSISAQEKARRSPGVSVSFTRGESSVRDAIG
jgi:ketol-acid reductoisomerase